MLEIQDFVIKLQDRHADWYALFDTKASPDVHFESHDTVANANGILIAQSLASDDYSALWRHASEELWQSLSKWQGRDEHRYYLVF
jgi:hypothetical protein